MNAARARWWRRSSARSSSAATWCGSGWPTTRRPRRPAIYRRLRAEMIRAERDVLLRLRDSGELDDHLLRTVQQQLDLEDALLLQAFEEPDERRGRLDELIPAAPSSCDHLAAAPVAAPVDSDGLVCPQCVPAGLGLGPPPPMHRLRRGGVLRLVAWPPRLRPLRGGGPPGHALGRAGRGLALVLRRSRSRLRTANSTHDASLSDAWCVENAPGGGRKAQRRSR